MWTLLVEARDAMVHLDGRLWRTLGALLLRPGFLTQEYFRERRASYVSPFRLYLAASVVFFSLAFVSGPSRGPGPVHLDAEDRAEARREMEQAAAELRATPGVPPAAVQALETAAREVKRAVPAGGAAPATGREAAPPDTDSPAARRDRMCQGIEVPGGGRVQQALRDACQRNLSDEGRSLGRNVAANVPRTMFVFLPLMALVMKGLYWRPRRYYVEHLVFFLQTHAAVFLLFAAALVLESLGRRTPGLLGASGLAGSAILWFYSGWYVWRSLRTFYGQGRILTLAKLAGVGLAYLVFLSVTLAGTVVVTALAA
jgi:hypothetical protein